MTTPPNPWLDLPSPDGSWVHPEDRAYVEAFNDVVGSKRPEHRLVVEARPEPWVGRIHRAPILVLSANPGWTDADVEATQRPEVARLVEANLSGEEPLFWLDPRVEDTPGGAWYRRRLLGEVLKHADTEQVADSVALVDFHAYHSKNWTPLPVTLPTQRYTFEVVRSRLQDEVVVVVTRATHEWLVAVPELVDHRLRFSTNSTRTPRLSPGNLPAPGWAAILERLTA